MATNHTLRQYTSQQVSYSLNIKDPTPNSKITNLVETVINELDNYTEYGSSVLDNMFIETCNSEYLDRVAAQEGLSRSRTRSFKINKNTNMVGMKNLSGRTYPRKFLQNTTIDLGNYLTLTFLEDVDASLLTEEVTPVSVEVKTNDMRATQLSIIKGTEYLTELDNVYVAFLEEINITVIEEAEEEFRARVLFARGSSNYGSESAIKSCIATSSFVESYTTDYDTTPPTIYLFSRALLILNDYADNLEVYSKPVIASHLNLKKADGTSYNLAVPSPVTFNIKIEARVSNPRTVPSDFFSFSEYLVKTFRFGEEVLIDTNSIRQHLMSLSVDLTFLDDYNVTFYKTYLNFEYAAENNSITIYKNEYPFLESTTTVQ